MGSIIGQRLPQERGPPARRSREPEQGGQRVDPGDVSYYIPYYEDAHRQAKPMGTRTVRLDEDAERTLSRLRKATGLSISEVLKRGLEAYEERARHEGSLRPYEVYRRLDLGAGGWSRAAAAEAKRAVAEVIRRKHRKKISGQRGAVRSEPPGLAKTRTRKDP